MTQSAPPQPETPERVPLAVHRRQLTFDAFEEGDDLLVTAFLRDERPWQTDARAVLHHMQLDVRVRKADLTITEATAGMHSFPHAECPLIAPKFGELVGMRVGSGFNTKLQAAFRGVSGCSQLFELSRALGSAVFQSVMSCNARARLKAVPEPQNPPVPPPAALVDRMVAPIRGTCHIWDEGGVAESKIRAGVDLNHGPYPIPALAPASPSK
ncbi:DUF2889 domain-containing protein [Yinghuangia seranimata]|uniref:DUF2889 domain-containing protein n=1 Tax=Yinghuangia seranimata TaxID=408067 RepID=UPI00248D279C|nr:DUF2889 domain-containing protein [Yinghuangia seranimata]MDI2126328.1 DUF2889 domain-containing protein [Yinghuangia seranimata]